MQLSVKGKQIDVGDALRQHVSEALSAAVEKYVGTAIEAQAIFSREAHLFRCDVAVHFGRDLAVQAQADAGDAYAAFDAAATRVAKRLRRYKGRLRDHHAKGRETPSAPAPTTVSARSYVIAAEPDEPAAEPAEPADGQPVIVAEMMTNIPTLTVSEAVMRLDLGDAPTFLFRNGKHGGLNVVYRRSDGNIGWVDPDLASPAPARPK